MTTRPPVVLNELLPARAGTLVISQNQVEAQRATHALRFGRACDGAHSSPTITTAHRRVTVYGARSLSGSDTGALYVDSTGAQIACPSLLRPRFQSSRGRVEPFSTRRQGRQVHHFRPVRARLDSCPSPGARIGVLNFLPSASYLEPQFLAGVALAHRQEAVGRLGEFLKKRNL